MSEKPRYRVKAPSVYVRPGEKIGVVVPFTPVSNPEVYDALRNIGALADEGIVDAIAIAVVYHNGGSGSCYSQGANRMVMLGEISMLEERLRSDFLKERVEHN